MALYSKIKWVLGILIVFVLVVTTNLIDRNNFVRVRDSVVNIYEDRLVAKYLIFEISTAIQKKELAVALNDSVFYAGQNASLNEKISDYIKRFDDTKLTTTEEKTLEELKANIASLRGYENGFIQSNFSEKEALVGQISTIKTNLKDLSEIQINEGKKLMSISKKAIDTVELFTQIEIYVLVFLAIVVQIIIMYSPKKNKKIEE